MSKKGLFAFAIAHFECATFILAWADVQSHTKFIARVRQRVAVPVQVILTAGTGFDQPALDSACGCAPSYDLQPVKQRGPI